MIRVQLSYLRLAGDTLRARDKAAGLGVTKMHEPHARFGQQPGEHRGFVTRRESARLRDGSVVAKRLCRDGNRSQAVGIARSTMRNARVGMDEDGPGLRERRRAGEGTVREEEPALVSDPKGTETFPTWASPSRELLVDRMPVLGSAACRSGRLGDLSRDGMNNE